MYVSGGFLDCQTAVEDPRQGNMGYSRDFCPIDAHVCFVFKHMGRKIHCRYVESCEYEELLV